MAEKFFSSYNDLKSILNTTKLKKKSSNLDIKDRYWVYLFQNLKLAVDEIYQTCEQDESILECEKAIAILENFMNEFKLLHQKLQLSRDLEIPNDIKPITMTWEQQLPQKSGNNSQYYNSHHHHHHYYHSKELQEQQQQQLQQRKDSADINEIYYQTVSLQQQLGKVDKILAMTTSNNNTADLYNSLNRNDENLHSVYTSTAPSPDYFNRLSDVSSVLSTFEANKYDDTMIKSPPFFGDIDERHDWDNDLLNQSRSTEYYKGDDHSDADIEEEDSSEYNEEKDYYGLLNSLNSANSVRRESINQTPCSADSIKPSDIHDEDAIDAVILKVYEHEENLARALEKEQDDELRSVMEQEAKLTKQLSVEHLKHYGTDSYMDGLSKQQKNRSKSAMSKHSFDYKNFKDAFNLNKKFQKRQLLDNELENELGLVRAPGRAIQMHERILQTSRKTSPSEHRRRHEEKQARAQEKRERFYEDRAQKLRDLTAKINEVRKIKLELLRAKKMTMKAKLQRAEEKRMYLLQMKAKKAADEEQKAHEILFINNLKEQHRRHDILERYEKRHEIRRQNLEEERVRKQEEQKTKDLAAKERIKEIETQRLAKLKEMQEKRRAKQSQIEKSLMKKEKERIESAKAKEKTREQRLAALEAQFKAKKEEEKKRIMQKQEEWSKRHESNLEEIRKKASEMSVFHAPCDESNFDASSNLSYERERYCRICSVIIVNDQHFKCLKHQQMLTEANQGKHLTKSEIEEFNLKCVVYIAMTDDKQSRQHQLVFAGLLNNGNNNEKKLTVKKRLKKLKNKIILRGTEYEATVDKPKASTTNNANKAKMTKLIKELTKAIEVAEKGGHGNEISSIDRTCREMIRLIDKNAANQTLFFELNGLSVSMNLLNSMGKSNELQRSSTKSLVLLLDLIGVCCKDNYDVCFNLISTNKILTVVEVMNFSLNLVLPSEHFIEGSNRHFNDSCVPNIIELLSGVLTCLFENNNHENEDQAFQLSPRVNDVISLIAGLGIFNKFSIYLSNIRTFHEDNRTVCTINNCLVMLTTMTKFVCAKKTACFDEKKNEDLIQLSNSFKSSGLIGVISMLYGLLHSDSIPYYKNDLIIKQLPSHVVQTLTMGLRMMNQSAVLDINMLQALLGEESLSLQLRHITSYLLWYCTQTSSNELLNEVILQIGFCAVLNPDNQEKIELGTPPTILQLLCRLPFNYFSDPKLSNILFPTLICCCYKNEKNKSVLSDELSTVLLANYIEEKLQIQELNQANNTTESISSRFDFEKRFPPKLWSDALQYFSE